MLHTILAIFSGLFWRHDSQDNDIEESNTQHGNKKYNIQHQASLGWLSLQLRVMFFITMMSVILLNVIMPSVVAPSFFFSFSMRFQHIGKVWRKNVTETVVFHALDSYDKKIRYLV